MYTNYYEGLKKCCLDYVCGSCGCLSHDPENTKSYRTMDPLLTSLKRPSNYEVPVPYSCGVPILDEMDIMIDRKSISDNGQFVCICSRCHEVLRQKRMPRQALCNYRWVDDVPEELTGLTFIEEQLIARGHFVGSILRLQERTSYHSIKGHLVLVPQETRKLVNLLPSLPAELTTFTGVVWIGGTNPSRPA